MVNNNDTHRLIGYVTIYSGSILFADGVVANNLPLGEDQRVVLDLENVTDNVRLPVIATQQSGSRFLVIPLDQAEPLPLPDQETVPITDPANTLPVEDEKKL